MEERESIIRNYLEGYNQFDVDKMIANFADDIVFENVSDDQITISLSGLKAFKEQAEQAKSYFSRREQKATSFEHKAKETHVAIDYSAILAMDFPNGLKKGDVLNLNGKSVFEFSGNHIVRLTDRS
jgi:hypothetical protein